MRYMVATLSVAILLTGCDYFYSPPSDEWLIKKVQDNYLEYLHAGNAMGKCLSSSATVPEGVDEKRYIREVCNSEIDPMQGHITFSEFKVFRHEGHTSICGVASGLTSFKQRTGVRMIVTDKNIDKFTWKRPAYPFAYLPYENKELADSMKSIMHEEQDLYDKTERAECRDN